VKNLRNDYAYRNSLWDWTPLNECFQGTNIRVTDIDGFVERNGRFLVIETKKPNEEVPQGQSITFEALVRTGVFTIFVVWGARGIPQEIKVLTRDGRNNKHYLKADMGLLQKIVTEWFRFADKQLAAISLPKTGSHVTSFSWDNSTLLVQALGHEGPCEACNVAMKKGSYFRVAGGRITHLECVRSWEPEKHVLNQTSDESQYFKHLS
jgi:hypothetical protein